ncbi:MAG: DUF2478 domain-containing protein [Candidatus Krumholzibacteriota bacterium]|nr:DUF2478 domain-containing protein [Candidatus Krumholzibacteriota bacterium]
MYLIAVTGPVGAGKTSLLARLLESALGRGLAADGFLAVAAGRDDARGGAAAYDLHWPATGRRLPFARRTPAGYAFDASAQAEALAWARLLSARPRLALVVMDEFGKREAAGGGHLALWPDVRAARPAVYALAVRGGLVDAVASRLGAPFARAFACDDPGAWPALAAACRARWRPSP